MENKDTLKKISYTTIDNISGFAGSDAHPGFTLQA
jgi:hypothetical protein